MIELTIHHYHHYADPIFRDILNKLEDMMATLDDVVSKVTAVGTVEDSVITLLGQIKAKLDAAGQDPTKLQALSDALDAQAAKLSQAVTDNTPAA